MKKTTSAVLAVAAVLLCGILATESAFARGPHSRVGIYLGVPFVGFGLGYGYGGYYPPYSPYYYNPSFYPTSVVVQQPQAPVYVEQGNPAPAQPQQPQQQQQQQSQGYWYYCAGSRAYYPYVKECPAGWQRVAPQPG